MPSGTHPTRAGAVAVDPERPGVVGGGALMGGETMAPGNVSPVAEANIWHDAEAAAAPPAREDHHGGPRRHHE
ncbi:nucleoside hydrolase, partial [Leucobacter sp. OLAS13]|uniref:nucleoside hydrolase n=1 Tax=Leucobacter sp. OLAS13 TaxID=1914917 RepID=UPI000C68E9CD